MKVSLKAMLAAAFCMTLVAGQAQAQLFFGENGDPTKLKDGPNFDYGGWIQAGWQDRNDGAFTGNGFFQNQKEFGTVHLNQLYTYVSKTADGEGGLDWGFRADMIYGVDGNEAQSFGNINPNRWDFLNGFGGPGDTQTHGPYEWAMPQAYVEVALGALSVKGGHFYTPIGYEVVTSPNNFFLSRQLTFYNSEPFTHTGVLGTLTASENLSLVGGWTAGWDTGFTSFNGGSNIVGGFTATLTENIVVYNYMAMGDFGWRGNGFINSAIVSLQWTDRLQSVHQVDILGTDGRNAGGVLFDFATDGITGDSVGAINYLFWNLTDKVRIGGRTELYKADGQTYWTNTAGINWQPHANLIFRPEVRRNDSNNPNDLFSRTIWGADMILTF